MSTDLEENRSLGERLQDNYRISVVEEETLKEVKLYRTTIFNILLYSSLLMLFLASIIVSIIFFTPVKRLVPGFGDIKENREFVELTRQVATLEEELETQQVYTRGLMRMLSGEDVSDLDLSDIETSELPASGDQPSSTNNVNATKAVKQLERFIFAAPVSGSISAQYNVSINHLGVDILAPKDTPVKSIADGIVITSDWTLETGNTLAIQHEDNLISFYKHNSTLLKNTGDYVTAGEAVAIIGNTGTLSSGPHLHFELWYDGKPINPELLINFE